MGLENPVFVCYIDEYHFIDMVKISETMNGAKCKM